MRLWIKTLDLFLRNALWRGIITNNLVATYSVLWEGKNKKNQINPYITNEIYT